jgi:hypothetical protein
MPNTIAGRGYSRDTQQITNQACFHSEENEGAKNTALLKLDTASLYSEVEQILGYSIQAEAEYGLFSGSAQANYMRKQIDKNYEFSLNYYNILLQEKSLSIIAHGKDSLTDFAIGLYESSDTLFGVICGDSYISKYSKSAYVIASLGISFSSHEVQKAFSSEITAKLILKGGMIDAIGTFSETANFLNIGGTITISAYQFGGDPSGLGRLIGQDSKEISNIASCSVDSIAHCQGIATTLLNYMSNDFSEQVSFETGDGLVILEDALFQYQSIDFLGLKEPKSLVTPEVLINRLKFTHEYKKHIFYRNELKILKEKYLPALSSVFYTEAMQNSNELQNSSEMQILKEKYLPSIGGWKSYTLDKLIDEKITDIKENIEALLDQHTGGITCYNDPRDCNAPNKVIVTTDEHYLEKLYTYAGAIYYKYSFERITNDYIVAWDTQSNLYNEILNASFKAQRIFDSIKFESDVITIPETLEHLTPDDLTPIDHTKYKLEFGFRHYNKGFFYRSGDITTKTGCSGISGQFFDGWKSSDAHTGGRIPSVDLTDEHYKYCIAHTDSRGTYAKLSFGGNFIGNDEYKGTSENRWAHGVDRGGGAVYSRIVSEFYFSAYDMPESYKPEVNTVSSSISITCDTSDKCFTSIDFNKLSLNVELIEIVTSPRIGILQTNTETLNSGDKFSPEQSFIQYKLDPNKISTLPLTEEIEFRGINNLEQSLVATLTIISTIVDRDTTENPLTSPPKNELTTAYPGSDSTPSSTDNVEINSFIVGLSTWCIFYEML